MAQTPFRLAPRTALFERVRHRLKIMEVMRNAELQIKKLDIDRKKSTNIKYYVAMMYTIAITGSETEIAAKLSGMAQLVIDTDDPTAATLKVTPMFRGNGRDRPSG